MAALVRALKTVKCPSCAAQSAAPYLRCAKCGTDFQPAWANIRVIAADDLKFRNPALDAAIVARLERAAAVHNIEVHLTGEAKKNESRLNIFVRWHNLQYVGRITAYPSGYALLGHNGYETQEVAFFVNWEGGIGSGTRVYTIDEMGAVYPDKSYYLGEAEFFTSFELKQFISVMLGWLVEARKPAPAVCPVPPKRGFLERLFG